MEIIEEIELLLKELDSEDAGYQQIKGVIYIVRGMNYHYTRFLSVVDEKSDDWFHEVTAYINRLGQIYYFFKSDFINIQNSEIPKILEAMPFRMKFSAHRHVDAPRSGDLLFDITLPNMIPIKARSGELEIGNIQKGQYTKGIDLAMQDANGERIDPVFFLEFEHAHIMQEIRDILSSKVNFHA